MTNKERKVLSEYIYLLEQAFERAKQHAEDHGKDLEDMTEFVMESGVHTEEQAEEIASDELDFRVHDKMDPEDSELLDKAKASLTEKNIGDTIIESLMDYMEQIKEEFDFIWWLKNNFSAKELQYLFDNDWLSLEHFKEAIKLIFEGQYEEIRYGLFEDDLPKSHEYTIDTMIHREYISKQDEDIIEILDELE